MILINNDIKHKLILLMFRLRNRGLKASIDIDYDDIKHELILLMYRGPKSKYR